MRFTSIALGVFMILSPCVEADEPTLGPAIEGYGPTFPINDRDVPVDEGTVYKAVFDIASYADDPTSLSSRLVSVARFLNMHARSGTPPEHMDLAVVLHGRALKTVFNDEAYRERFGVDNPNLELVRKLADAGVSFYVCGQSMAFGGYAKSELAPQARLALSAMTMLTELQNHGYALLP